MEQQNVKQNLLRLFQTNELESVNLALQMLSGLLHNGEIELDSELKETISICTLKLTKDYEVRKVCLGVMYINFDEFDILRRSRVGKAISDDFASSLFELTITLVSAKQADCMNTMPNEIRFMNGLSMLLRHTVPVYTLSYCFANAWQWTFEIDNDKFLAL